MTANAQIAFLKLLSSPDAPTYQLNLTQDTIVGREPSCQIVLDSQQYIGVSRRHSAIRYKPELQGFELSDLGSSNGTFINGQRLQGSHTLQPNDRIQLGANGPEFSFEDPASLPPTIVQPSAPPRYSPTTPAAGHQGGEFRGDYQGNYSVPPSTPVSPTPVGGYQGNYSVPPSTPVSPTPVGGYQGENYQGNYQDNYSAPSPSPLSLSSQSRTSSGAIFGIAIGILVGLAALGGVAYWILTNYGDRDDSSSSTTFQSPSPDPDRQASTDPPETEPPSPPSTQFEGQTYRDPDGLFQLILPDNYATEKLDGSSVIFNSPNNRFQGIALARTLEGQFSSTELEEDFKQRLSDNTSLSNVEFQNTKVLPDGRVQVDWIARETETNAVIDAVSFVGHNGTVFSELTLFGVDSPFQDHLSEAQLIIDGFSVRS
ncbi:MAG: FHA domain-containing protein [Cyanobacteria bacterium CRU_2_1]|nr:FHA domain-containing protein [Cyanobacteria bacterium RU_5_0]NJR58029.1 FHA domain-containing protein [Cyanobacteria bacterium CRU_2_1]